MVGGQVKALRRITRAVTVRSQELVETGVAYRDSRRAADAFITLDTELAHAVKSLVMIAPIEELS